MRWRGQRGQTAAEYLGVLLVVAAVIAAIGASGIGATIASSVSRAICEVSGQPDCGVSANGDAPASSAPGRTTSRAQETARERYDLLSSTAGDADAGSTLGAAQGRSGADRPTGDGASQAGEPDSNASSFYYARESFGPLGFNSVPPFSSFERRDAILNQRAMDGSVRDGFGVATPRPGDADGDGLRDPQPSRQSQGGVGDRFAGEACGLAESTLFGALKGPVCSLGDDSTDGWQQGRQLGNLASIVVPDPSRLARLRNAAPSRAAPPRPNPGGHNGAPQPPPRAPEAPTRAGSSQPRDPGARTGTRQTREERRARTDRPAQRPSPDRDALLFKFDPKRPVEPRAGEQRLDLPPPGRPDGTFDTRALYRQNMGQLREAMRSRRPIRERDPAFRRRGAGRGGDFLEAERQALRNRGWTQRGDTWYPPDG